MESSVRRRQSGLDTAWKLAVMLAATAAAAFYTASCFEVTTASIEPSLRDLRRDLASDIEASARTLREEIQTVSIHLGAHVATDVETVWETAFPERDLSSLQVYSRLTLLWEIGRDERRKREELVGQFREELIKDWLTHIAEEEAIRLADALDRLEESDALCRLEESLWDRSIAHRPGMRTVGPGRYGRLIRRGVWVLGWPLNVADAVVRIVNASYSRDPGFFPLHGLPASSYRAMPEPEPVP